MPIISKADFLAKDDATYKEVDLPGWGTVRVRNLSGKGRDTYMSGVFEWKKDGTRSLKTEDSESRLLAVTLVDEEGNLWFDNMEEGVQILREKNVGSLQKAFHEAMKLSGLQTEAMEEAVENLDEITNVEPGSD